MTQFSMLVRVKGLRRVASLLAVSYLTGCQIGVEKIASCVQTEPVRSYGDAADDAAIWVNPADPAATVVIGTDKKAGLHVYDLAGRELQFVPLGETNNVDLLPDFLFADGAAPIVATTNRTTGTVMLLRFDPDKRRLVPEPVAEIPHEPRTYGVCLYRAADGIVHVGATADRGPFSQWRLDISDSGELSSKLVRKVLFDTATEGCVFDHQLGRLYVGEEERGIWRFAADPAYGDDRVLVDEVSWLRDFPDEIEGLDIYALDNGGGYLLASNQGNSTFRVYRRDNNEYVGRFEIAGCTETKMGNVTNTDGISVVSASLGPQWPQGLLVVQDHRDGGEEQRQNFRYVSWADVARKMKLAPGEYATKSSGR
jgi:3-phytase